MVLEGLLAPDGALVVLLLVVVLVVLSALLAGTEAALLSFPRARRRDAAPPDRRHQRVERLLEHPQRILLTVAFGTTALNVAAAALAAMLAVALWPGRPLYDLALVVGLGTIVLLTFGQVVPKGVGSHRAETWALAAAAPYTVVAWLLWPLVGLYLVLGRRITGLAGKSEAQTGAYASEEELKTLITLGAEEGILEEEEEEMIHSVLELDSTIAREVMVPRADIVAVPADATLDHVRAFVLDAGYSRVPVYQGSLDNIVGVMFVKEMLVRLLEGKGSLHVREVMREPLFVPETKKLDDLLAEMREKHVHLALIVDEFGGVSGLITLEDLIEEIVGEIGDEWDLRQEPIKEVDERTALVDARTHIEDVNAALGTTLPEDAPYDTIGGYVFHKLGRLGREGEKVPSGDRDVVVDKVVNRRILRVRIVRRDEPRLPGDGQPARREGAGAP